VELEKFSNMSDRPRPCPRGLGRNQEGTGKHLRFQYNSTPLRRLVSLSMIQVKPIEFGTWGKVG